MSEARERHFAALAEAMPQMAWIAAADGAVIYVNPAWESYTGLTLTHMKSRGFAAALHPAEEYELSGRWREAISAGRTLQMRCRLKQGVTGQFQWFVLHVVPTRDDAGAVNCWFAIATDAENSSDSAPIRRASDAPDRMQVEASLRESDRRFHALADNAPVAIFIKDLEGRYTFANQLACEAVGHPEGIIGLVDSDLVPVSQVDELRNQDIELLTKRRPIEREVNMNGRWFLLVKSPLYGVAGQPLGVCGMALDITDRKRTAQLYRAIGESIDYGVWVCDTQGRNIYFSESFLKLVGRAQQECSGFGWVAVLHPDEADSTLAAWKKCVQEGGTWDREQRFKGADGDYHPILARGVPVRDENGVILYWAGINLDVSRLKQAEEALLDADKRKDDFLAVLAHELRNPLAPIRNSLESMKLQGPPETQHAAQEIIERQLSNLVRLVDDLLDVSRITRGKLELRLDEALLSDVIDSAVETVRTYISAAHHQLEVQLPDLPIRMRVDSMRLAQVVANLLHNSAKYTPPGGLLRLQATLVADGLDIAVEDNGVGIPDHALGKVFDMFTQVEGSKGRTAGGLGIGLALVKGLVEMHGGSVRASSKGEGLGSRFTVHLPPSALCMPRSDESASAPNSARDSATYRILVVDDNRDSASSMAMLLDLLGHDTRQAFDGLQAVAAAKDFKPDFILMDIGMPNMDGLEAARRIRLLPLSRQPVIAAMTGWGQHTDRQLTQRAGIDHHLVKPVALDAVVELFRKHHS